MDKIDDVVYHEKSSNTSFIGSVIKINKKYFDAKKTTFDIVINDVDGQDVILKNVSLDEIEVFNSEWEPPVSFCFQNIKTHFSENIFSCVIVLTLYKRFNAKLYLTFNFITCFLKLIVSWSCRKS